MAFEVVLSTPGNPNFTESASGSAALREDWAIFLQTVILTITTLLVIVGNALCFVVLLRSRDNNEVTRLCMLFLTATDIGIGFLICVPITGATAVDRWPYGDAYCLVIAGSAILVSMSSFFVVAVNVERFVAIVWPLRSTTYITIPRARNVLMLIVATGVVFAVLYCFLPGRSAVYHPHFHTCFMDPDDDDSKPDIVGVMTAWIFGFVPFLVTLLLYSRLYRIARRHARQISVMEGVPNRRGIKRSDLKTATTFFIITAVLALSWLPFGVVICYEGLTRFEAHPVATFISLVLILSNSYWNILIYSIRDSKFRRAGTKFLQDCLCRACRQGSRGEDIGVSRAHIDSQSPKSNFALTSNV